MSRRRQRVSQSIACVTSPGAGEAGIDRCGKAFNVCRVFGRLEDFRSKLVF